MIRLLFVCIENSCRSQMAEAFARIHGSENVQAYSAGSSPSGVVNEKAVAAMHDLGYDLSCHRSKPLEDLPDVTFDYVVAVGCGDRCPLVPARHRVAWDITDPKDLPRDAFDTVRDDIGTRVRELLARLT